MNKSIKIIGLIITSLLVLYTTIALWAQPLTNDLQKVTPTDIEQKLMQFRKLVEEKETENVDIFKAIKLNRLSSEAIRSGNIEEGIRLLDEAILTLKTGKLSPTHSASGTYPSELLQVPKEDRYKTIEMGVNSTEVILTQAVPNFQYGKDVSSYKYAFPGTVVEAVDGKLKIHISSIPVFVEEGVVRGESKQVPSTEVSLNSPFGGTPIPKQQFDGEYKHLGVKWIRYSGKSMAWDIVERQKGVYDWSLSDRLFSETSTNGIQSLITVRSFNRWDQYTIKTEKGKLFRPKAPVDMTRYLKFLAKAAERYDGDGVDDAPGSPIVNYWQIENEVDGNHGDYWGDTPESYARLLKASYLTIKKVNPNAKIVIAGASCVKGFYSFYIQALKELRNIADHPGDRYFDISDIHWYGFAGDYRAIDGHDLRDFLDSHNKILSSYGYAGIPLWMTETGTYGGQEVVGRGRSLPKQNETTQAAELVKRYIYFIDNGVKKIFWHQMTEDHHDGNGAKNGYFENVGLIRNVINKGDAHKKLAYYSYKLLVEMLEGSDWKTIRRLDFGKDVYAYRFLKSGKTIYVLWYDPVD